MFPGHPDQLWQRYSSASEREADTVLEQLLACLNRPVRTFLHHRQVGRDDLEDIYCTTMHQLLIGFRRKRAQNREAIHDCLAYARTTADHAWRHHRQSGQPQLLLKRQICYQLDATAAGNPLARWNSGRVWLGGFARWHGTDPRITDHYRLLQSDPGVIWRQAFPHVDPATLPLPELLCRFLTWIDTPLEIRELTRHIGVLQRLEPITLVALEELVETGELRRLVEADPVGAEVRGRVMGEQTAGRLWHEIGLLPPLQRAALLLHLAWEDLALLGVPMADIAASLDMRAAQFIPLTHYLPLSDCEIADRLGTTVQRTANLRKSARERLNRHKTTWDM
jgi:hypothetical protein